MVWVMARYKRVSQRDAAELLQMLVKQQGLAAKHLTGQLPSGVPQSLFLGPIHPG